MKSGTPLSPRCRGQRPSCGSAETMLGRGRGLKGLLAGRPFKVAAVAHANKTARSSGRF